MSYFVYILYSPSADVYYKGQTSDISERLKRHNSGREKATKHGIPWELVWATNKATRGEALKLERKLKNLSRERTTQFIQKYKVGVAGPDDSRGMSGC
ncbi:GIY-YIG nuclease family protein [Draconibacterium sediminis]|uniref:Excinuclease ABC subunit C n=1 Tax=Draconibacterium sediminis TaxID=1544798 RepID=A0A0D8JCD4_9BACT|nr:GIY-YIG nuclease family protein [Draconibacterium sediminis]KJF44645.1 excinuclease ABC subunit C [Draconibacterium sediminis]